MIPVGPWAPDTPELENAGSSEALNVIPAARSYRPFPSFASISDALNSRAQGAIFVRKADASGIVFAGNATKLYQLSQTTFSDVSRTSGGAYACPADGRWSFVQFGSNILAFNGADAPQTFAIETDTDFSALSGSPPTALYACIAGDFVMTGNQPTARQRAQWSAINNSASWATSQTTQASQQDLPDGGWITGLVGIEYGAIIFQEFAIRRASYEGPPLIFRFSRISDGLGCSLPGSIAAFRDLVFFVDRSGFYMLQGGVQITPIGEQRVNNEFWALVDQTNLFRTTAAIDPVNSLYAVAFPDKSATGGNPNHLFIYNWIVDRFTHVQPGDLDMIFSAATQQGFTMEQLDSITANLDALPFSLDSAVWAGVASRLLGGFSTSHKVGFFNGMPLAATVETTEASPVAGRLARIRSARPLVDGATPSMALGTRNRQFDSVTWGSTIQANSLGSCPFNVAARYVRGRISMPAGASWTHLMGIDDLDAKAEGRQ
jgi:hypothetical protein